MVSFTARYIQYLRLPLPPPCQVLQLSSQSHTLSLPKSKVLPSSPRSGITESQPRGRHPSSLFGFGLLTDTSLHLPLWITEGTSRLPSVQQKTSKWAKGYKRRRHSPPSPPVPAAPRPQGPEPTPTLASARAPQCIATREDAAGCKGTHRGCHGQYPSDCSPT